MHNQQRQHRGGVGEEIAINYLVNRGMRLVERNYRSKYGEIDAILCDGEMLVFVEVKTKLEGSEIRPEEMFDRRKYLRVKRMAIVYLSGKEVECRIDMVAVEIGIDGRIVDVRHYPGVVWD